MLLHTSSEVTDNTKFRFKYRGGGGIRTLTSANLNLCDPSAVLNQLSYPANWERVVMWVDYKRVDVEIDDNNTAWFSLSQ